MNKVVPPTWLAGPNPAAFHRSRSVFWLRGVKRALESGTIGHGARQQADDVGTFGVS